MIADSAKPEKSPRRPPPRGVIPHGLVTSGAITAMSRAERGVLLVVAGFLNGETGEGFPSVETIRRLVGLKFGRNVRVALESLEDKGILRARRRPGLPTIYAILSPEGSAAAGQPSAVVGRGSRRGESDLAPQQRRGSAAVGQPSAAAAPRTLISEANVEPLRGSNGSEAGAPPRHLVPARASAAGAPEKTSRAERIRAEIAATDVVDASDPEDAAWLRAEAERHGLDRSIKGDPP